jgi:wyosine [tRNA(Phe)-imidazoG37] synthetase (radical SAM superfamily)
MEFVFGPVASRRLGLSLGVNIVPHKICSFDCLYCEVGKTTNLSVKRTQFFEISDLLEEFESKYKKLSDNVDVVTVTGAGEPTLNINLGEIAKILKSIINKPLVLLTNSSLINSDEIKKEISYFDIVVPSIDAVSEKIFKQINKPHKTIDIQNIIKGMIDFSQNYEGILYPEVLLLKNINDTEDEIKKIAEVINKMKYKTVHLTTAFRPTPYKEAKALNQEELFSASLLFAKYGVKIKISNFLYDKHKLNNIDKNLERMIYKLLKMRPCSQEEICYIFSIENNICNKLLNKMLKSDKIVKRLYNGKEFFLQNNKVR